MRSARNESSAQYWSRTLTFRSIAAAPTASTAAAVSLSSVPENRTRESVSSISASLPRSTRASHRPIGPIGAGSPGTGGPDDGVPRGVGHASIGRDLRKREVGAVKFESEVVPESLERLRKIE